MSIYTVDYRYSAVANVLLQVWSCPSTGLTHFPLVLIQCLCAPVPGGYSLGVSGSGIPPLKISGIVHSWYSWPLPMLCYRPHWVGSQNDLANFLEVGSLWASVSCTPPLKISGIVHSCSSWPWPTFWDTFHPVGPQADLAEFWGCIYFVWQRYSTI